MEFLNFGKGVEVQPPKNKVQYFPNTRGATEMGNAPRRDIEIYPTLQRIKRAGRPKKPKKLLFKEIGKVMGSISSIKNMIGSKISESAKELQKLLAREKTIHRQIMNRGATQTKKMVLHKGGTIKDAQKQKAMYREQCNNELKKMMFKVQLMAMKEINNRLK